jgi:hypothetical protein
MIDIDYQNINRLSNVVYQNAVAKGFHEAGKTETEVQKLARYTANLHGEVSELWEAARNLLATKTQSCKISVGLAL